jgi:hypothetical protein
LTNWQREWRWRSLCGTREGSASTARRLILAILVAKAVGVAIDPTIRLYLGDSAAFLAGGQYDTWLPPDRSFVYSLLIRRLVRPLESLWALLFWQTVAGVLVALLLWTLLTRYLDVRRAVAFVAAMAFALEPAQLYYERMVLAETFGLLAFAAFIGAAAAYVASGRAAWLPAAAVLGLAATSLRLNYLPVVLVVSVALPLVRALDPARAPAWRPLLAHGLIAVLSVATTHTAYRLAVGAMFDVPPTYLARSGFMQLGLVTPLLTSDHLARVGLPRDIEAQLKYPLSERRASLAHMWAPGGLAHVLAQRQLDVDRVGGDLFRVAVADDPLGLARLGLQRMGDYFRPESRWHALDNDLGRRPIPEDLLATLRDAWGYDARGVPARDTLVSRYFAAGSWWLVACLFGLIPLATADTILHWRSPRRPVILLVALVSVGLVLAHMLFVNVPFYRYLHPLPFVVVLHLMSLGSRARGRAVPFCDRLWFAVRRRESPLQ